MTITLAANGVRTVLIDGHPFHFAPEQPRRHVYLAPNGILVRSCQARTISEWETNVVAYLYHSWRHWYRNIRRWNRGHWGANFRSWFQAPGTAPA